jgi:hypothetical protein
MQTAEAWYQSTGEAFAATHRVKSQARMLHTVLSPLFVRTREEFNRAVQLGSTAESEVLEFKADIGPRGDPKQKAKSQLEVARDIAQFANGVGGCLIYGIEEERLDSGQIVGTRIREFVGIEEKSQWIGQAITKHLVPSTLAVEFHPLTTASGTVLALNIPGHSESVLVWNAPNSIECVIRRGSHKIFLNPSEMILHMTNKGRAVKITLCRLSADFEARKLHKEVILASGIWSRSAVTAGVRAERLVRSDERITLRRLSEYELELGCNGGDCVSVPYGLVLEAWITADARIGLMLGAKIVREDRLLFLES